MINAVIGLTGRTDNAHAALVIAGLHAARAELVTLVRVTVRGEARLPGREVTPTEFRLSEREVERPAQAVDLALAAIRDAADDGRNAVLDLPGDCAFDPAIRNAVASVVLTVGPTPFDEHVAATAMNDHRANEDADAVPQPWLLGCGRSGGGPAALAFARRMRGLCEGRAARVLPAVLPLLTRGEAAGLVTGRPASRTISGGLPILAVLRAIHEASEPASIDHEALVSALAAFRDGVRMPDGRDLGERLRDLGDGLHAIRDGIEPTDRDLGDAPRLEDWRAVTKRVHVLTGRVSGHPTIPDGRRIATSEIYASDEGWARTLSRFYRLGRPAGADAGAGLS